MRKGIDCMMASGENRITLDSPRVHETLRKYSRQMLLGI